MSNPQRANAALKAAIAVNGDNEEEAILNLLIHLEHHCKARHINLKRVQWHATWIYHNTPPAWITEFVESNPLYWYRRAS